MKNHYLLLFIFVSAILCSCGSEEEGRISLNDAPPSKVSGINSSSGPGEVYLTWKIPTDPSFMYTKIEYLSSKGELKYQLFSKDRAQEDGTIKATISGFANTDPVKFSFYACSVRGNNNGAVELEASPDTPAFAIVAETIDLTPGYGGVNVSWENTSVAPVYIALNYHSKNDSGKAGSDKFKVNANSKGTRFVALSTDVAEYLSGEACVINVTTEDEEENASKVFPFEKTPLKINKIARNNWVFPGFLDANDATIGYSSQEAGGEGAYPNGRVVALIDGDLGSFWHTAWKTASAYPHFFIIDMGEDANVSNFDLRRRTGNNGTHKGQIFYTCSDQGAVDKSNPDSWDWKEQGTYTFDPTTDKTQMYALDSPATARYIKVYFGTNHKGSSDFVMISEINVYSAGN